MNPYCNDNWGEFDHKAWLEECRAEDERELAFRLTRYEWMLRKILEEKKARP